MEGKKETEVKSGEFTIIRIESVCTEGNKEEEGWRLARKSASERLVQVAKEDPAILWEMASTQRRRKRQKEEEGGRISSEDSIPEQIRQAKQNLQRAQTVESRDRCRQLLAALLAEEVKFGIDEGAKTARKKKQTKINKELAEERRKKRKRLWHTLRVAEETPEERAARLERQKLANAQIRTRCFLEENETPEERKRRLALRNELLAAGEHERLREVELELAREVKDRLRGPDYVVRHERYLARKRAAARREREKTAPQDQAAARRRQAAKGGHMTKEEVQERLEQARARRAQRKAEKAETLFPGEIDCKKIDKLPQDMPLPQIVTNTLICPPIVSNPPIVADPPAQTADGGDKVVFLVPLQQYVALTGMLLPPPEPTHILPDSPPDEQQEVRIKSEPNWSEEQKPVLRPVVTDLEVEYSPEEEQKPVLCNQPVDTELRKCVVEDSTEQKPLRNTIPDIPSAHENNPLLTLNGQVVKVKTEPLDD